MFFKFQYLLLFSIFLVFPAHASIFGPDPISIGETKNMYLNPPFNPGHIFLLNLTSKLPNEDLTILTFPKTPSSHPLVILSKTAFNVTNFNESDPELQDSIYSKCFGHGIEICSIPEANLTENSVIYITLLCEAKCYFELQVNYHQEIVSNIDTVIWIDFADKTSEIIKIPIPPENQNSDHLVIDAKLMNPYIVKEPFHIYINQGNSIPSSEAHDYHVETTWEDGKGISIDKYPKDNKKALCFKCNFTLMVEADVKSLIKIESRLFSNVREIHLGEQIHDIVNYDQNTTYILKVEPNYSSIYLNESLHFRLKPYSGHSILFINFNQNPTSFEHYAYKIIGRREEDFVLTPENREKLFPNFTDIYLSVYGETDATYQISVNTALDSLRRIEFGVAETGILAYKEVINYNFDIMEIVAMNLTIDLINEIGYSDIMMQYCQNNSSCEFKYEDYINNKDNSNLIFFTENKESKLHIQFHHDFEKCKIVDSKSNNNGILSKIFHWINDFIFRKKYAKKCSYVLGVVANNSKFHLNRYNLLLNYEKKLNILQESQIIRSSLSLDSYDDYVFTALNDPTINSIIFQLTCISGEVSAYSSKNSTVDDKSFQKRTEYDYDAIEYKRENKEESMAGRYYVRVFAKSSSYYTLTTFVDRTKRVKKNETIMKNNETNETNSNNNNNTVNQTSPLNYSIYDAIKLYNGLTQKISYRSNYSFPNYFQVSLNYSQEDLKEIEEVFHLSVNPIKGKFMIFLGVDFVPNIDNYTWSSLNNSISIHASDPRFKNPAVIYIMVRNVHSKNLENYEFLITFSSNSTIVDLRLGIPLQIFFMAGDERHFSFNLDVEKMVDFILSKSVNGIHSDSIRVFISTNKSNVYPDERNFDLEMNDSSLIISNSDKKNICEHLAHICLIFITVKAYENADFSLIIKTNETLILLIDGNPSLLPISQNEHPFKLYFHPPKEQTISISTYSIYKKTAIYVNIIPLNLAASEKDSWTFPTNVSFQFSSINHTSFDSTSLVLHESDFIDKKCNEIPSGCVITIRVYPHNMPDYYSYLSQPYFSIVASSEITKLTPNVAHISSVKDKAYQYFLIYANINDTVFISLTPLSSGDPDLVVSYGIETRPTLDENDWILRTFGGENLEITPEELYSRTKKNLPGFYVVGVFGFKNCTFSLTAMIGSMKFMKISMGNPVQLSLKGKETIYLDYFHYLKEGFKIIVVEELGEVEIYINKKDTDDDYVDCLPKIDNTSSYKWDNLKQIHKNLLSIPKSDLNFCNLCRYFVAIYSAKPTKVTVLISVSNYTMSLQSGKTLNDWLLPFENNRYTIFSNTGGLDINLVIYSGDPIVYVTKSFGDKSGLTLQQSEKKNDSKLIHMRIFSDDNIKRGGYVGISYTILVKSLNDKEANYSILAVTSFHEKYLKYGALDFTSLKGGDSQTYVFSAIFNESLKEINQTLTISIVFSNIEETNGESLLKNEYEYFYPNVSFELLPSNTSSSSKAEVVKQHFSGKLANYVLKAENSKYRMNITNPGNETMNFTVMINNANFNTILPNSENFGLVPLNNSDNYEIINSNKELLLIEAFECSGKVQIFSTDNYENARKREFDMKTVNNLDNHLILSRKSENNYLFFSVNSYEIDAEAMKKLSDLTKINRTYNYNEAYYKLSSIILPLDADSPYEKFFYNRQIEWTFNDILLQITFKTVKSNEAPDRKAEYEVIEYLYALYISDDVEILESVVQCNSPLNSKRTNKYPYLSLNYASLYFNGSTHPNQANFNINSSHLIKKFFDFDEFHLKPLFFGVQAKVLVRGHDNFLTLTFIYEQNQIYFSKTVALVPEMQSSESGNKALVIGLIIVGVIIVIVGLIFGRRYLIIKKKLEFEVFASKNEEIIDQSHETHSSRKDYQGFSNEKNQSEV